MNNVIALLLGLELKRTNVKKPDSVIYKDNIFQMKSTGTHTGNFNKLKVELTRTQRIKIELIKFIIKV